MNKTACQLSETSLPESQIDGQLLQYVCQSMDMVPDEVDRHWKDNRRIVLRRYAEIKKKT